MPLDFSDLFDPKFSQVGPVPSYQSPCLPPPVYLPLSAAPPVLPLSVPPSMTTRRPGPPAQPRASTRPLPVSVPFPLTTALPVPPPVAPPAGEPPPIKLGKRTMDDYLTRSKIPKRADLLRTTPFGKPSTDHVFLVEKRVHHVILPLFKSGFLSSFDCRLLFLALPMTKILHSAWQKLLVNPATRVDILQLRRPEMRGMSAATLAATRMDLLLATLLHYDMEFPMVLRFLGGNYLGLHRDPDVILPRLRGIVDPTVCDALERILWTGTPNRLNAELPRDQFEAYWRYGNHPSFRQNAHAAVKMIQKEVSRQHVVPFPRWVGWFLLNLMTTPQGLVQEGPEKWRIVFDGSVRLLPDSIPLNDHVDLLDEPALAFPAAWRQFLIQLYNLRISYPHREIYLMTDDATAAFRIPKHHPDVATGVSMLAGPYLLLFAGGVFGSNFSAASWEPFARARCELATHYSRHNIPVPEYKEYLDALEFSDEPFALEDLVPATRDHYNPGVIGPDGRRDPTQFKMHVDDALYAEVSRAKIRLAIRYSLHALFQILGEDHPDRYSAMSHSKLVQALISHARRALGRLVDSRALTVSLPPDKQQKLLQLLLDEWPVTARTFTIGAAARLVGTVVDASHVAPWARYAILHLSNDFQHAMREIHARLRNSRRYRQLHLQRDKIWRKTPTSRRLKWFDSKMGQFLWRAKAQVPISKSLRRELGELRQLIQLAPWFRPIRHCIPHTFDVVVPGDACLIGGGGVSPTQRVLWALDWPDAIVARTRLSPTNPAYLHINVLEHLAILVGFIMAVWAWEENPFGPHPSFLILTDNTTAEAWLRCLSVAKNPYSRAIAKLFLRVMIQYPFCGLTANYIPGDENDIADFLSRLRRNNTLTGTSLPRALQRNFPQCATYKRFHPTSELLTLLWSSLSGRYPNFQTPLPPLGNFVPM